MIQAENTPRARAATSDDICDASFQYRAQDEQRLQSQCQAQNKQCLQSQSRAQGGSQPQPQPQHNPQAALKSKPVKLAVFDFDGTCIKGNSPVLLVMYLMKRNMLKKSVLARIALWAFAYKFRLPQNESWVRGLVFSAFAGMPKEEVDDFLAKFYTEEIAHLFREDATRTMIKRADEGCEIVVVSATFEPIVIEAMKTHPFSLQISTRMRTSSENTYLCEVEGLPVEGQEKVDALTRFANEHYGRGKWQLTFAYGDHHSDEPLLKAANNAYAITPDKPLMRIAKRAGWEILDWS